MQRSVEILDAKLSKHLDPIQDQLTELVQQVIAAKKGDTGPLDPSKVPPEHPSDPSVIQGKKS